MVPQRGESSALYEICYSPGLGFCERAKAPPILAGDGPAELRLTVIQHILHLTQYCCFILGRQIGGCPYRDILVSHQQACKAIKVAHCLPNCRALGKLVPDPEQLELVPSHCSTGLLRPEGTKVTASASTTAEPVKGKVAWN